MIMLAVLRCTASIRGAASCLLQIATIVPGIGLRAPRQCRVARLFSLDQSTRLAACVDTLIAGGLLIGELWHNDHSGMKNCVIIA